MMSSSKRACVADEVASPLFKLDALSLSCVTKMLDFADLKMLSSTSKKVTSLLSKDSRTQQLQCEYDSLMFDFSLKMSMLEDMRKAYDDAFISPDELANIASAYESERVADYYAALSELKTWMVSADNAAHMLWKQFRDGSARRSLELSGLVSYLKAGDVWVLDWSDLPEESANYQPPIFSNNYFANQEGDLEQTLFLFDEEQAGLLECDEDPFEG